MSIDLFNTQLLARQLPPGTEFTGVADGAGSKSLCHSQSHDALGSNDQEFLKTLERLRDNPQPPQESNPSDKDELTITADNPLNSAGNDDVSHTLDPSHNIIEANSQIAAGNNFAAIEHNIDPVNISLFDLLKHLGLEFLLADGHGRMDEPAVQGEKAKSGVAPEFPVPDSTRLSSIDLLKLEKLLIHLQADNNPNLSGKSREFQIVAENLKEAIKTINENQAGNEKTTVADLLRKIGYQLSQPSSSSQNMELAASRSNISRDTTEGDKNLLARLDAGWSSKYLNGSKNFMAQSPTEVHRLSSNLIKEPAPEIGPNAQKQILKNDLQGNPVVKSESTPFVFNPPSHVNHANPEQTGKMTNLNPGPVFTNKAVAQVPTAESDVKDGGFLFNQSQNEVKTPEAKLVIPETGMFQKDFRSQTVNQIVQKAILHLNGGQHEVRLDLKPEFLGHIRMQIITESQQVTVRISTEYPMVKELIESNLQQLKLELQNHGLEIDELDVSVEGDADRHVADRKMNAQAKANLWTENDEQSDIGHLEDAKNDRVGPYRIEGATRIDFFA